MADQWFRDGDLSAALEVHGQKVLKRIPNLDTQLIRFSTDAVIAELVDESVVVPLTFSWNEVSRTAPRETTVEVMQFSERFSVAGKSVTLIVPFAGDPMIFLFRASTRSLSGFPYDVQLTGSTLRLEISDSDLTPAKISATLERFKNDIENRAGWAKNDIVAWQAQIRVRIADEVGTRRKQLDELAELDEALEIPLAPSPTNVRVEVPLRPKRLMVNVTGAAPSSADPRIAEGHHREILSIIGNLGRAQERVPMTASKFNEEELRDLILFVLNANFAGAAKGEVFSGNGKTDIFLDWNGRNAFIAECKVWRGQKQFASGIDQLLSYTVWRDSKAALILFIRGTEATSVITKAGETLAAHPRFVLHSHNPDTGLEHYMMKSSTDEARLIDVAFIPFVVVTPPKTAS